jgi:hypothetical protein
LPLRTKLLSTLAAVLLVGAFALFGTSSLVLRLVLAGVILVKVVVMVAIPTDRGGGPTQGGGGTQGGGPTQGGDRSGK